jgi:hypothetical protein
MLVNSPMGKPIKRSRKTAAGAAKRSAKKRDMQRIRKSVRDLISNSPPFIGRQYSAEERREHEVQAWKEHDKKIENDAEIAAISDATAKATVIALSAQIPSDPRKGTGVSSTRRQMIEPILKQKGFSVTEWASKSGVDVHTALNYLNEKTKNPDASTRKKLAEGLGINVGQFPA